MLGALAIGLVFCTEHLRDTLFIRPHPALWRLVGGCGLFYAMFLAFALFQPVGVLQDMMQSLDPVHSTGRHGQALEQTYGGACEFTVSNVYAATDRFVLAHFFGWAAKATMFRHVGISMVSSVLFELMEYTFEFLQPNFAECWWDHWILDFLLCNTGGILLGHVLMDAFGSKEYAWAGMRDLPSVRGKLARLGAQFTPYVWTRYEWAVFSDPKRFAYVTAMVVGTMVIELDAFFLKYILHVTPASPLNVYRLLLWWAVGMVALRDYYAFMTNPAIKRLGATMWTVLAMMLLEFIVVLRFGSAEWAGKRPPQAVIVWWSVALVVSTIALTWWFGYELPKRKAAASGTHAKPRGRQQ